MLIDADTLRTLIESELANVSDARVIEHIRGMLVEPNVVLRSWDYGEPGQKYPCWMVLKDASRSGGAIAYCEYGFGPRCPWGLVSSGDDVKDQSMGMDSGWFTTFLDAFFESVASIDLAIWRVFEVKPGGARTPLTDEGTWEATWKRIADLRSSHPATRYDCGHSISIGN
jgi:hypothetical protein